MKRNALFNMIEQQIRPWDVSNPAVLKILHDLPREAFLPPTHKAFAYMDTELPLIIDGNDTQTKLLAPKVLARIVQAVYPSKSENVAQVGLGDGYLTAMLARFAKSVTVFELNEHILHFAQHNLNKHAVRNVNYELNDGLKASTEKFDVVVLAGSVSDISDALKQKLNIGGCLFVIVGAENAATMHAVLVTRHSETEWTKEILFETVAPALTQAHNHETFEF